MSSTMSFMCCPIARATIPLPMCRKKQGCFVYYLPGMHSLCRQLAIKPFSHLTCFLQFFFTLYMTLQSSQVRPTRIKKFENKNLKNSLPSRVITNRKQLNFTSLILRHFAQSPEGAQTVQNIVK